MRLADGGSGPGPVTDSVVYQIWRSVTGRELPAAVRQEFTAQAAALHLADVGGPQLAAAAGRVFTAFGALLLADWREEIDEPGLAGLRAVSSEWPGNAESAALTLQAEIASLIGAVSTGRDTRPVLGRRLGLDGAQRIPLGALGAEYGVSRERIRQLQERQLRRLARLAGRSRRAALLQEVIRGLAARQGQPPGAALDEIAGLVFPEAVPGVGFRTLAVLVGYPRRLHAQLTAQAAQARECRATARRARREEEAELARARMPLRRLVAGASWPARPALWPGDDRDQFRRTRQVRDWEHSGQFPSARLGRMVAYESGLEHQFLQLCERSPDVTWYQEQPLVIPYTLAGTRHDYHPDVLIQLADGRRLLAEIKHLFEMATAAAQAKHAAAWQWCTRHGAGLLVTDLKVTRAQLMQRTIPPQTLALFTARLAQAPMRWPEVHALQITTGMSARDLTACCLRHDWIIDTAPWRLRQR